VKIHACPGNLATPARRAVWWAGAIFTLAAAAFLAVHTGLHLYDHLQLRKFRGSWDDTKGE